MFFVCDTRKKILFIIYNLLDFYVHAFNLRGGLKVRRTLGEQKSNNYLLRKTKLKAIFALSPTQVFKVP